MTDFSKELRYRLLFISIVIIAVYCSSLGHRFVWDDVNIIVDNPLLGKLSNIPKFFVMEDIADGPTGYYRPITYVSFALDRAVWGLNPLGFNITNLALHVLVALAFYRTVAALFKRENLALVAALLFALHPIAGETINFHAGGRNTLLSALFALLSLLFWVKRKQIPAILCFTLAIFSKEFALLLPALFLLYDRLVAKERIRPLRYLPYLAATVCYLTLRSYAVVSGNLLKTMKLDNAWIAPQIVVSYLKNMLLPVGLKTMYDVNTQVTWLPFIGYSVLILAIVAVALFFRKRSELPFAAAMFLLFLLPVTNIFPLGMAWMADRYAYFASFGFALALAYCICLARKQAAIAVTAALLVLYIAVDLQRTAYWKDELSFFTQMTKDAPGMSVGYQNLGYAYNDKGDFANADKFFTLALAKSDVNARMLLGSASAFWRMGKLDKAIGALNMKIAMEPANTESYVMASRIYHELGNETMAAWYHDKATALSPGIFEQMSQRAVATCRQGEELMAAHDLAAAEQLFKVALEADPEFVPALLDMGGIVAEKGNPGKALEYFSKAARLAPLNASVHYNLSMAYDMMGKASDAQAEMARFKDLDARSGKKSGAAQQ